MVLKKMRGGKNAVMVYAFNCLFIRRKFMKIKIAPALIAAFFASSVVASDCQFLDLPLPKVNIPNINVEVAPNRLFCFDPSAEKDQSLVDQFSALKKEGVFDENNCLIEEKRNASNVDAIGKLIVDSVKGDLYVYAVPNADNLRLSHLVLTNSKDDGFVQKAFTSEASMSVKPISKNEGRVSLTGEVIEDKDALNTKDKVSIAAAAVGGSLIGIIHERSAYKGQHDKLLHSNFGVVANLVGVGAAYYAIEVAGLGKKLGLSKNQKKWGILLAGTLAGIALGYGKERLYDYYHQDIHTYDPHFKGDMGATWDGGGKYNVLAGAISFSF
jgi:hypothetical protein